MSKSTRHITEYRLRKNAEPWLIITTSSTTFTILMKPASCSQVVDLIDMRDQITDAIKVLEEAEK